MYKVGKSSFMLAITLHNSEFLQALMELFQKRRELVLDIKWIRAKEVVES